MRVSRKSDNETIKCSMVNAMTAESSRCLGTPNLVFDVKDGLWEVVMSRLSLQLRNIWKSMRIR